MENKKDKLQEMESTEIKEVQIVTESDEENLGELEDNLPTEAQIDNEEEIKVAPVSIEKAPKTVTSKKTGSENNIIHEIGISDGLDDDELNEDELERQRWADLQTIYKKEKILESLVYAVEPDAKTMTVKIITSFGGFDRIVIPEQEYFYDDSFKAEYFKESEANKFKRRFQMARSALGARISFIIAGMQRTKNKDGSYSYAIVASRRAASVYKRNYYFFDPKGPKVSVGDIVEPRIISMNRIWVKVEALGVECSMNIKQMSASHWIKDCTKEFKVGQKIQARIKKIVADEHTGKVSMILSRNDLRVNTLADNISKAFPGMVAIGEVVAYNREKKIATVVLHGDILAAIPRDRMLGGEIIYPGDKVSVSVTHVFQDKGFVIGSAVRINSNY